MPITTYANSIASVRVLRYHEGVQSTRNRISLGLGSLVLIGSLAGCDKPISDSKTGSADETKQASAPEAKGNEEAKGDAAKVEPTPANADAPTPEPTPTPVPTPRSEFDDLLVRLSGLPEPAKAVEPSVEQDNKTGWAHYKANEHELAAQLFARVAARDPAWKHAHNIACALAKAGKPDDARIALAESFRRGGEAAKESAKKDSDLSAVRELPWFDALSTGEPTPSEGTIADAGVAADEGEEDEPTPPASCPRSGDISDHWCWRDILGSFTFAEVVFDKPITLDIEVPKRPADRPWTPAKGKISMQDVRAELGVQHTTEAYGAHALPFIMEPEEEGPLSEDGPDTKPFFWWPNDSTPVLVMLQRQKLGKMRFLGVILARKTDAGWRATNLEVVTSKLDPSSSNAELESAVAFRSDGLELFTLAQLAFDGEPLDRYLCRIRWEQGKLARACVDKWTPAFDL